MSAKRKLARNTRTRQKVEPSALVDKQALRRQTSRERFKTPGSDQLWEALLGWDELRLRRIWLVEAIHDLSAARADDAPPTLPTRLSSHERSFEAERMARAVSLWASDGDDYRPDNPSPKWHFLVSWLEQLGWEPPSPEALQDDWETWTNLGLAGKPRTVLMQLLQQTEKASLDLDGLTSSDNIKAIANISRALWFALAYGDEDTFDRIRHWSEQFSPRLPGR